MILAENLSKTYGSKQAVKSLDFTVQQGTLYGFLGPNGAGKTTSIRMLTGLLRPSGGRVEISGVDAVNSPLEAKRRMGLVPATSRYSLTSSRPGSSCGLWGTCMA